MDGESDWNSFFQVFDASLVGVGGYAVVWQGLEDPGVARELLEHLGRGVGTSLCLHYQVLL
eukprot:1062861-Pelagomonas_calceolata.AAC.1